MDITLEKYELAKWLQTIENPEIIEQIKKIKTESSFDFEKEWKRSISGDELKRRTKEKISTWKWTE